MTVTGWIGIGSLGVVGSGMCVSVVYSAREAVRRSLARRNEEPAEVTTANR